MHVAGYTLHLGDFEGDGPDTVQGRLGALSGFYDHGLDVGRCSVGSVLHHGAPARVAVASFPPMARSW
jgi:hypothetical protein